MAASLLQRMEFYQRIMRESDYKAGTLKVAFALLFTFYNSRTGRCDPGRKRLGQEAGVGHGQVKLAVGQLRTGGWFEALVGQGAVTQFGRTTAYRPRFDREQAAHRAAQGDRDLDPLATTVDTVDEGSVTEVGEDRDGGHTHDQRGGIRMTPEQGKDSRPSANPPSLPQFGGPIEGRADALPVFAKIDQFEIFWRAYPSRGSHSNPKKPARVKFEAAVKRGADPAAIVRGARAYAVHVEHDGVNSRYVAQATTWLSQERWNDAQQTQEDRPRAGMC